MEPQQSGQEGLMGGATTRRTGGSYGRGHNKADRRVLWAGPQQGGQEGLMGGATTRRLGGSYGRGHNKTVRRILWAGPTSTNVSVSTASQCYASTPVSEVCTRTPSTHTPSIHTKHTHTHQAHTQNTFSPQKRSIESVDVRKKGLYESIFT